MGKRHLTYSAGRRRSVRIEHRVLNGVVVKKNYLLVKRKANIDFDVVRARFRGIGYRADRVFGMNERIAPVRHVIRRSAENSRISRRIRDKRSNCFIIRLRRSYHTVHPV